jgi:cytoskeletal protein CcmA (bactofilin family)
MQAEWTAVLFILTIGLFTVPLWPAFIEIRRKTPYVLAIDRKNDGSSDYAALQAIQHNEDALVMGNLRVESGASIATAQCTGDLHVGQGTSISALRAQHIYLNAAVTVHDVASATHTLSVQPDCQFCWLDAPVVKFIAATDNAPLIPHCNEDIPLQLEDELRHKQDKFTRIDGNWHIEQKTQLLGNYVVTQDVVLASDCKVLGNIKAYGNVKLCERSQVHGSVFAEGRIELSSAATVLGVVSSRQAVLLQAGSVVGHVNQLSSVSAPYIVAHAGAIVHGSVRARMQGWSHA